VNNANGPAVTTSGHGEIVWRPDPFRVQATAMHRFATAMMTSGATPSADYDVLWRWSIDHPREFWTTIAQDAEIAWTSSPDRSIGRRSMPGAEWFEGGTLNYVDLALRRRDDTPAIIFRQEDGDGFTLTWNELAEQVRLAAAGLRRLGVGTGDRVAGYVSNRPETIVAFLAVAAIGAVWTASSPDFGEQSVLDRFQQVEPKVLLTVSGYTYNGRWHDRSQVAARLVAGLPSLRHVVSLPGGVIAGALAWADLLTDSEEPLSPVAVAFDHPLWIVYTSGTTGRPKSIVHGHGGIMLEHYKLLRLHLDLDERDRFFWFTTTGWVMWNIVVGGLLVGTPIVIYDGSPTHPNPERLWDLAAETGTTFLGLSAGFIQNAKRSGHRPAAARDISHVRSVGVTGSPLPADCYGWLLDNLGADVFIASVSGGTDVATAFIGCTPTLPVRAGSLQACCLGVDAVAVDEAGERVVGSTGELVVRQPIPSMPIYFWGDDTGDRYRSSYFEQFPGVWRHGDWVLFDEDG
jgi:acetoacetyl-CoA synthetase